MKHNFVTFTLNGSLESFCSLPLECLCVPALGEDCKVTVVPVVLLDLFTVVFVLPARVDGLLLAEDVEFRIVDTAPLWCSFLG